MAASRRPAARRGSRLIPLRAASVAALLAASAASAAHLVAQAGPASGIRLRAEHRTRLEQLETDFRASPTDGLTAAALRTLVAVEFGRPTAYLAVELEDARVYADDFAPLNTTQVDALELLSAYVGLHRSGLVARDDQASLRLGRITLDRGSRRLVARNRYRNTINGFAGIDLAWTTPSRGVRAFALLPVTRLPSDQASLADNEVQIDEENADALFWGVQYEADTGDRVGVEAYVVGLHERDGEAASANRRLVTPGVRLFRDDRPGTIDFELEGMLQLGTSRASAATSDEEDLTHRALAGHASVGYRFRGTWSPRLVFLFDHASGDRDPDDDRNGRFDPLFGARAFDLNATGFYGAFARSNISARGVRIEAVPHGRIELLADYRRYALASARDAWTTTGLRDATGSSGTVLGRQVEGRIRARLLPGTATLDVGGVVLSRGSFAREVEGGRSDAALYFYTQVTVVGVWP